MSNHDAFLQAILDEPDEDAPRLVYADWLEERGDADRAEFIRAQIELARLPAGDRRGSVLRKREAALLEKHREAWLRPLNKIIETGEFRRGFVERVRMDGKKLLKHAETLFRATPVRSLQVAPVLPDLRTDFLETGMIDLFNRLSCTSLLTGLNLCGLEMEDKHIEELAAARYLSHLRALDVSDNWFGVRGMRALAESPVLRNLDELTLGSSTLEGGIGESALEALLDSPLLARLTALNIENSDITETTLLRLVQSPQAIRLDTLNLEGNEVTGKVLRALVETAERAQRWRKLGLRYSRLDNAGIRSLAKSPHLTNLEILELGENFITLAGARALAASPSLQALKRLDLSLNGIPPAGKDALIKRFGARVCRFT